MRIMGNGQVNEDGTEFCSNASSSGGDTLCQRSYSTGTFGGDVLLSFTAQPGVGWKTVEPTFVDDPLNPDFECLISEGDPEPEDDLAVDTACLVTFVPKNFTLNVSTTGDGGGLVTSDVPDINCGAECTQRYENEPVILSANSDAGSTFEGWSGCDSVSGNQCTISMGDNKSIMASFATEPGFGTTVAALTGGSAVTIDFDDVVLRETGTARIRDEFRDLGVIFEEFQPDTGGWGTVVVVKDLQGGNGAVSLPNSVAFGFQDRIVRATFVDPDTGDPAVTDFVSAQVGDKSGEVDPITMKAFDIDGGPLGESSFTSTGVGHFGLVSISVPGIHRVEFHNAHPSGADFDDFTFGSLMAAP